jgi:integrase
MGTVYRRPGSKFYQYQFTPRGAKEPVRGSTKATNKKEAEKFLARLEADADRGVRTDIYMRTTFEDFEKVVVTDAERKGNKTVYKTEYNVERLKEFFGNRPVIDLIHSPGLIEDYKEHRLKSVSRSTVNRELSTLRRGYRLLKQANLIATVPNMTFFREQNARQRFFTLPQFQRFVAAIHKVAPYLEGPVELAFRTGWRRGTIFSIEWKHIDRENMLITAPGVLTKNGEPVIYPYDEDGVIYEIIERQWENRKEGCPYVFPNVSGTGKVKDFRGAWGKALTEAGLGSGYGSGFQDGLKWHDLRRSAFILNEEAGVPRSVSMEISGTKSDNIWRRYNIVNLNRMSKGIAQRQKFLRQKGAGSGKVSPRRPKKIVSDMVSHMEEEIARMEYDAIKRK